MDEPLARYFLGLEPGPPPPLQRAPVYRQLVRGSLRAAIADDFPVTESVLGEAEFRALVDGFFDAGGPKTAFYRDIPGDFVDWAIAAEHPYADLIQYEWLEVMASRHPADLDALAPLAEGLVRPNPTMQVGVYARPVHSISEAMPDPPPFEAPMAYLVWRRPRTDEIELHRVGMLIAGALARASESPSTVDDLAAGLAADGRLQGIDPAVLAKSLEGTCRELRSRHGIL